MVNVGKIAPDISCEAVLSGIIKHFNLYGIHDRMKLLFFYPLDFTFVCPTELHALQERIAEFTERKVDVIAISVDSVYSHQAWLETPKNRGGIAGISYLLLSDITKVIARSYGVLDEDRGVALRGAFLLDRDNTVQYAAINNLPLGRSVTELLRVVDALIHVQKVGEVCPADWQPEKKAMKPTAGGVREYFAS